MTERIELTQVPLPLDGDEREFYTWEDSRNGPIAPEVTPDIVVPLDPVVPGVDTNPENLKEGVIIFDNSLIDE